MGRVEGSRRAGLIGVAMILGVGLAGCSDCSLSVSTQAVPGAVVGVSYFTQLDSHCGGDYWFLQTGQLPPGIGLQDNGDIEGVPTLPGIFTFTVGVFDFDSQETAYKGLVLTVLPPPTPTP